MRKLGRAFTILLGAGAAAFFLAGRPGSALGADLSPALSSLVESERAFARTSMEKGIRPAFLAYFADDGIVFQPHPTIYKEDAAKNPQPSPPPITLDWAPYWADVSAAGDLGYTTGPYLLTDKGPQKHPPRRGYFFSIWRRPSADAPWRVAVDAGIPAGDAPEVRTVELHPAPHPALPKTDRPPYPETAQRNLVEAERKLADDVARRGAAAAYAPRLDPAARMARGGTGQLAGASAIQSYLENQNAKLAFEPPIKTEVSRSSDLGYSYGRCESAKAGEPAGKVGNMEKGYYVRVWRRAADGSWKIVFDTFSPIPPEQK